MLVNVTALPTAAELLNTPDVPLIVPPATASAVRVVPAGLLENAPATSAAVAPAPPAVNVKPFRVSVCAAPNAVKVCVLASL